MIAEGRRIPYDYLILATGAQHAYFGHGDWAAFAPGLKTIDDATYIRRRILLAFEKAETETDPAERARLLNFVIVGGGPTGVEMAGAIAELANRALAEDFRSIDPRCGAHHPGRGGAAPAHAVRSAAVGSRADIARTARRRGAARRGRDRARCRRASRSARERIEARTVIWARGRDGLARRRNGSAPRPIAPAA